jgi:hypothetical protein
VVVITTLAQVMVTQTLIKILISMRSKPMKMTPFLIKLLKEKELRKEVINKFKVKK